MDGLPADEAGSPHAVDPTSRAVRIGADGAELGAGGESDRLEGYDVFPDDALSTVERDVEGRAIKLYAWCRGGGEGAEGNHEHGHSRSAEGRHRNRGSREPNRGGREPKALPAIQVSRTVTAAAVGQVRPSITRIVVGFPAPFRPRNP